MKKIHIVKRDGHSEEKPKPVIWEGDVEVPENADEYIATWGKDRMYNKAMQKELIDIRSANDPRKVASLLPRNAIDEIKAAREAGVDVEAILASVRKLRTQVTGQEKGK